MGGRGRERGMRGGRERERVRECESIIGGERNTKRECGSEGERDKEWE
jgi:hypothetical protein